MAKEKEKLLIPILSFIKSHERRDIDDNILEYCWEIFQVSNIVCVLTFNEDDNGKLILDVLQNGYIHKTQPQGFGVQYPLTKEGYASMKEACLAYYEDLVLELANSNKALYETWQ